jgi:hypothetical protein
MNQLKWMTLCVVVAAGALIAPAAATATPFSYPFNDSNQNFTVLQSGASTPATLVLTGGNPGGFIRFTDAIAETGCPTVAPCDPSLFEGPNPLPGPLTANYGGTWSFDFKTDVAPSVNKNVYLIIDSGGVGLVKSIPPANTTNWQHFSGSLTEPGWLLYDFGVGTSAPATEAQFKSVLSDAIATDVQPDVYTGSGEHYGLDNFVFTNGPQPAASPPAAATPAATAPARKKCKKGRKLKHGKCVKKKVRK